MHTKKEKEKREKKRKKKKPAVCAALSEVTDRGDGFSRPNRYRARWNYHQNETGRGDKRASSRKLYRLG
ncbi:hypothetical protein PUN28_001478 [Cardiocondyla obscurior]|uniref:Uncharacterized protein n=1 Tax=Cardiocondyla obscurior TaxID=286306 RepID=A0AAW2H5H6_9HYME